MKTTSKIPEALYFQHILHSLSLGHWFSMGMRVLPKRGLWKFVGIFGCHNVIQIAVTTL